MKFDRSVFPLYTSGFLEDWIEFKAHLFEFDPTLDKLEYLVLVLKNWKKIVYKHMRFEFFLPCNAM